MAEDLKSTLSLPRTEFPMRADLAAREPEQLTRWQEMDLLAKVRQARAGKPPFVLHDGPPYANGHIHLGTLLNKTLKDMINKYWTMQGKDARYVPGWDTHGLPIERAVQLREGNDIRLDPVKLRQACRAYAQEYIGIMSEEFKRLGVRADWDHPYVTLSPAFEAEEVRVFARMYELGLISKDFKSVNWCPDCETALAEAEIEYQDITSPSLFVAFPVVAASGTLRSGDQLLAWTTTAWTLPANRALAVHPELTYVRTTSPHGTLVLGKSAHQRLQEVLDLGPVQAEFPGQTMVGAGVDHPLETRTVPVLAGQHVTDSEGTGVVHTAPGHGEEDFDLGRAAQLEVAVPIDGKGVFTTQAGSLAGTHYTAAYAPIVTQLRARQRLVHELAYRHSYPHCWRCHNQILFRATEQWFGSISKIRPQLLAAIAEVSWSPAWGEARMRQMTEERGEWCISRQRAWGLPIPALYCQSCQRIVVSEAAHTIAEAFAEKGSDVWFTHPAETFLPPDFTCPQCGGNAFRKETDILDVWFDSGSSHASVLGGAEGLGWPADLYLEGTDQFRGWFNSSLTTAVAIRGTAPYRQVLSHGFVTDQLGDKMSKSRGNVVTPAELMTTYGADILRLWVASSDYRADISVSDTILAQTAEAYRKLRNTIRFLLGNVGDVSSPLPPSHELPELERLILSRMDRVIERVDNAYRRFDFHIVTQQLVNFAAVDLSSFYLDVRKDLLYTAHPEDPQRKAAVAVCEHVARCLILLLAPIMTFTAEEAWRYLPHPPQDPETVQLASFPVTQGWYDEALEARYLDLDRLRGRVLRALETMRAAGHIRSSLEAGVVLTAEGSALQSLQQAAALLPTLFVVSQVTLVDGPADEIKVAAEVAAGHKCERCWRVLPEVVERGRGRICDRCADVLDRLDGAQL
ncbi:MAG: isoleucine--tRNA ligase [Sulfobacillus sp.]